MNKLFIKPTSVTPRVSFDQESGEMGLHGRSTPENPLEFYEPILQWIVSYVENPSDVTLLRIFLKYSNTSSSKCILQLIKRFQTLVPKGKKLTIEWLYEEG